MIERIKIIINPEDKQIDEMSSNEMIELLIKLNKCLRCLDSEEVRSDGMIAGDMVAPTREVQDKVLDYLMNNISKIKDKVTTLERIRCIKEYANVGKIISAIILEIGRKDTLTVDTLN